MGCLGDRRSRSWWTQMQRSMRRLHVVVRGVYGKHPAEVSLAEDQHPVGEFGADGQHEALGGAVRPWTPSRDLDHLDTPIRQHRIERGRELSGPIAGLSTGPGRGRPGLYHRPGGRTSGDGVGRGQRIIASATSELRAAPSTCRAEINAHRAAEAWLRRDDVRSAEAWRQLPGCGLRISGHVLRVRVGLRDA
jgi:hypothetical protein